MSNEAAGKPEPDNAGDDTLSGTGPNVDPHLLFRFWSLLRQTYMLLLKSQERSLASHSVNFAQYMVLFMVHYSQREITPSTIATYLSHETPSVTYGLDRLEAKGL